MRWASNRHRVASGQELFRLGFSQQQIQRRVADGRLVRRYRGVYVVGPGSLTDHGDRLAAALFAAPDGVVSHHDAASILSLAVGGTGGIIDVTCPRRIRAPKGIRPHRSPLPSDERTIRLNIPVTSTGRTMLDCAAAGATPRDVEKMLNEAYVKGLPIKPPLGEILTRYPRHRGLAALRTALRRFTGPTTRTRSDLEEDYLAFLDRHGFPRPLLNHRIETHIGTLTVDCAWPAQRVVIELDAPSTHGSGPRMLNDRRRDRALILAGWTPGRVMEEDLDDEAALAAEITGLLAA